MLYDYLNCNVQFFPATLNCWGSRLKQKWGKEEQKLLFLFSSEERIFLKLGSSLPPLLTKYDTLFAKSVED